MLDIEFIADCRTCVFNKGDRQHFPCGEDSCRLYNKKDKKEIVSWGKKFPKKFYTFIVVKKSRWSQDKVKMNWVILTWLKCSNSKAFRVFKSRSQDEFIFLYKYRFVDIKNLTCWRTYIFKINNSSWLLKSKIAQRAPKPWYCYIVMYN